MAAIPSTLGAQAQVTVTFTTSGTGALAAGTGKINVNFPATATVPAGISPSAVTVNGLGAAAVSVSGQTVSITTPAAIGNSQAVTVVFASTAGIKNPTANSSLTVNTTADTANSADMAYNVTGQVTGVSFSASSYAANLATAQYNIGFTTGAAGTLSAGTDKIILDFPSGTLFPNTASNYVINNVAATAVAVLGGTKVEITTPVDIGNNSPVNIVITGVTNPSAGNNLTGTVATSIESTPVNTPAFNIGSTVAPGATNSTSSVPGAQSGYTVGFKTSGSGALAAGSGTITITYPAGFTVPASITPSYITVNGAAASTVKTSGQAVTITAPVAIGNGKSVSVLISPSAGITNPSTAGTYAPTVKTSADTIAVPNGNFTISGNTKVSVPVVTFGTGAQPTPLGIDSYSIAFNTSASGALAANTGTISITFPNSAVLPASIPANGITVNGVALSEAPTIVGQTVKMTTPVAIGNSAAVTVAIDEAAGIKNGSGVSDTISVSTSADTTAVSSANITYNAGTAVTNVAITPAPATVGAPAKYTIGFNATTTIPKGGTITVTLPSGYVLPTSKAAYTLNTTGGAAIDVITNPTANSVEITTATNASGTGVASVAIDGVTNPATAGTYAGSVVTSADAAPVFATYNVGTVATAVTPGGAPTISDNTAGANAQYQVVFNTSVSGALTAGTGTIVITFPAGTTVPATIAGTNVSVNGVLATTVGVSGNTLTITSPVNVSGGSQVTVVIAAAAGIKNPAAGTYALQVQTSSDQLLTNAGPFTIDPAGSSVSGLNFSASSYTAAGTSNYTITFTTGANCALASGNGTITLDVLDSKNNVVSGVLPGTVPSYVVNGVAAEKIAGNTITVANDIPANTAVSLIVNGASNPAAGAYHLQLTTSANATPVNSSDFTIGTQVGTVTVTPATATAGSVSQYTVDTTATSGLAIGDTVSITFPAGTVVPATIAANNVTVNNIVASAVSVSGQTVTVTSPVAVNNGASLTVVFASAAGITNPSTVADNWTASACTSKDSSPVTSEKYNTTAAATGVTNATVTPNPAGVGSTSVYTVTFTTTSALPGNSKIYIILPPGTVATSDLSNYVVNNVAAAKVVVAAVGGTGTNRSVTITTTAQDIAAGASITVVMNNVTNPSTPGTDYAATIYTSADGKQVNSAGYSIVAGSVAQFVVSGPASAQTGQAASFTVTAQDANDNTVLDYSGPVVLTSSDATAVLPATVTFSKGVATINVTFKTVGSQTVTVKDQTTPAIMGVSGAVNVTAAPVIPTNGYTLLGADGGIFNFGDSIFSGSVPGLINDKVIPSAQPAVSIAQAGNGNYWVLNADGGVFTFGNSITFHGSLPGIGVTGVTPVQIVATPGNGGYWILCSNGMVYGFGDAQAFGTSALGKMNNGATAVGMSATTDGKGYYVVASDGTVYNFGDAAASGSVTLKAGTATAVAAEGSGFVVLGSDGQVYAMGGAQNYGDPVNTNHLTLDGKAIGITTTLDGQGYYILGADGGIFNYGDAQPSYYMNDPKDYPHSMSVPGLILDHVIPSAAASLAFGVTP